MKTKKMGLLSATFLSVSSILGSGWLFAPYHAALAAGPASILSWILAAVVMLLLALCFAEIAALYPKRGLSAIIPTLSHNQYFGFPFAIANWLSVVAVIGLEADATIQYLINLVPQWTTLFFIHGQLTYPGLSLSIALIVFFCLLNFWGSRVLTKTNNLLSIIKIIIPVVVALIVIAYAFHPHNFSSPQFHFVTYGYTSIFTAILTSGIIVAFNGFQTVISFSSEVKKAARTIPVAVTIAIVLCLAVYLLLQIAFIGGIPAKMLAHGWHQLYLTAPMIELVGFLGLGMLTTIIYFGATVAPIGSAVVFMGASSRMFTAMSRNKQMPKYFDRVHSRYRVSRRSLIFNSLFAMAFVLIFRSWSQLAQVLSLFHVVSYLPIPIALIIFRNATKGQYRSYIVPFGKTISLFLFVFFTYLFTMGNFTIVSELMLLFLILHVLFIVINIRSLRTVFMALQKSALLVAYFLYLFIMTYASPVNAHLVSAVGFNVIVVITAIAFFYLLTRSEHDDEDLIHSAVRIYQEEPEPAESVDIKS